MTSILELSLSFALDLCEFWIMGMTSREGAMLLSEALLSCLSSLMHTTQQARLSTWFIRLD